jgi:hypothetical protein
MKFGKKINVKPSTTPILSDPADNMQADLYNEWREHYLDYNELKSSLKVGTCWQRIPDLLILFYSGGPRIAIGLHKMKVNL